MKPYYVNIFAAGFCAAGAVGAVVAGSAIVFSLQCLLVAVNVVMAFFVAKKGGAQ